VISTDSSAGLLNKAFQLAYFILGDRDAALCAVTGALAKLEVAFVAQGKRLYYRPTGRLWSRRSQSNRFRNNISFNEPHLLQRLVYIESEPFEIAQEQAKGSAAVGEEDLLIHFIKHLTKKTVKRNSFYVTLGLSRLLYSYTTAETMDIYNAVIQDPARVKDDYYYRSRKGVLMQELKQRFGDLINICHGPRGEERFEADNNQGRFVELVRECLSFFTPWHTPCLVPVGIDPITDGIPSFSYQGHNKEDKIEVNRIHAVLHPECFERLTADLRFDSPDTRLEIPRFYASDMNGNGSNRNRRNPRNLDENELQSITNSLDLNAARRKAANANLLRIMVDGMEQARIDLDKTSSTSFELDTDAELIEVRSRDNAGEEVLLASHLLTPSEAENGFQSANASIILEGGQKVAIRTSAEFSDAGMIVEITYRETNPFHAASFWFHRLVRSISSGSTRTIWNDRRVLVPALAVLLLAVGLVAVIKYGRKPNPSAAQHDQVATSQQSAIPSERKIPETGNGGTESSKASNAAETSRQKRQGVGLSPKTGNTARQPAQPVTDTKTETITETAIETRNTRNLRTVPLSAVKKIYVEMVGDAASGQGVREALINKLSLSKLVKLASTQDEADALLEVSFLKTDRAELETIRVVVELIDARGKTIWPNANSNHMYQGSARGVTSSISKDLLAAIRSAQRK
jgi:hypothetical protein